MESEKLQIYKNRLFVSDLIIEVLTNKKTVSEALSVFPKDKNDINLKCAFDALMHREADEDLRNKVKGYKETQDEFLMDLAKILKENERLPKNIIEEYLKYHKDDLIYKESKDFKSIFKKLRRMVNF